MDEKEFLKQHATVSYAHILGLMEVALYNSCDDSEDEGDQISAQEFLEEEFSERYGMYEVDTETFDRPAEVVGPNEDCQRLASMAISRWKGAANDMR
jgi:hypothetical protein